MKIAKVAARAVVVTTVLLALLGAATHFLALPEGLDGTYFNTIDWSSPPVRSAIDTQPSTAALIAAWDRRPPNRFSTTWYGSFIALRNGNYTIGSTSDDGSWVFIDGQLVVDNGGNHSATLATGSLHLDRGVHTIYIRYFQTAGPLYFALSWNRNEAPLQVVPGWALTPGRPPFWRFLFSVLLRFLFTASAVAWIAACALALVAVPWPKLLAEARRRTSRSGDRSLNSVIEPLVMLLALFLPCRYLWPLDANFYVDWYNHKWAIAYFGEYFRNHWVMPGVFNTTQWGGTAVPIFYGSLIYPLLGLPASVLASGLVIRLAAILLFALQYRWVAQAAERLQAPRLLARTVACLVIWATYPLTNLFNRGALTEFFATSLLVCALSQAILLFREPSQALARRHASGMMLCLVISAGTHPITALFGIPFFGAIGLLLWRALGERPERRRFVLRTLVPGFLGSIACLASWLYATAKYTNHLAIRYAFADVNFISGSLDHWLTRFYPFPFDARVRPGVPLNGISTPYLDTQVNVPLLILFLALSVAAVWRLRQAGHAGSLLASVGIPVSLFGFFTWMSLSPDSYHYLPSIALMIQWAYRAVTYQNLALLLGVFLVLMALQDGTSAPRTRVLNHPALRAIAIGCLLLAAYGVTIKWSHIRAIRVLDRDSARVSLNERQRQALIDIPSQYYGTFDYTTPDRFVPLNAEESKNLVPVTFGFDSRDRFGTALPLQLVFDELSWVRTNVQAFPWNRFEIDGRDVPESDIRMYENVGIALRVPAGRHRLTFRFAPDPVWAILRMISLLSLFSWLLAEIALRVAQPWRPWRPWRRRRDAIGPAQANGDQVDVTG